MTVTSKKYLTAIAATAVLALGLYGCGGGGGSGPVTGEPQPMPVDLASVTAGFMAGAGTVQVPAGQSIDHGDIAFSCAAGGADCEVMVMVDANGGITATSTGGTVTAMNSDAYTARITPMAVDLASVTAGFMAGAGAVQVPAGQSVDHGDIAFSCAAGGADCEVMVTVDANGDITAASTGGMVTAMNSDAYTDRMATMHPVVGKWAGDWPGGARTVLTITSVSSDGQVTGTYRHQERGGQPFVLEISPDGPVTASIQNGVLSFSFGQSTFEFTETAEDTLSFTFQFSPDAQMVSVDVDRQDADGMMPSDVPSADALANVIDLVANDSRQDVLGNYVGGWWWRSHNIGAQQAAVTGTYSGGQWVNAIVSHDENGQLQHNVAVFQQNPLQEANPWARPGRYINTYDAPEELEGVANSTRSITDHGLGSEWQVTELTADYDNSGSLSIYVATDAQPSDGSMDPFELATDVEYNIQLPSAPALPADQDFLVVWIPNGDSIEGSLDGVAGTFSCANPDGCAFVDDHTPGDYYASDAGLTFTPDVGAAQPVLPRSTGIVTSADYLALGHWLYVPNDVTDSVNYEFGVYASGGDPFDITHLAALTGTATYLGDAVGMYYVDGLSSSPTVGSFTADAILTADFGDGSETGFVSGEVNNFAFEDDVASSLPEKVTLASRTYDYLPEGFGVSPGSTNIFDTAWRNDSPYPGGQIGGVTEANVDGEDWYGQWHGAFYGNGLATTDIPPSYVEHPSSVAGVFGTSTWNDNNRTDRGLTGAFGAHRYDDKGLTRGDPQELASTIDEVTNYYRLEDSVWTAGFWHSDATGGGEYGAAVSQNRRRDGAYAYAVASHDDSEQLHFNVAVIQRDPLQSANPFVLDGRYINTYQNNADLEGVTWFRSSKSDPELAGWHLEELSSSRENGGTLDISIATDVQTSDGAKDPWEAEQYAENSIRLPGAPNLEADKDFILVWIADGESIAGSLDDVAGTFSCANAEGCTFIDNQYRGPYYATTSGITFTPAGGSPQSVIPWEPAAVPAADYLAFGHWLYVPEDETDADAYDFGVFASGGDAFSVAGLMALTGTATYNGDAAGLYYADGLSSSPDIGTFTADVELMVDFKSSSEYGTVEGEVNSFVFDGNANSSFASLYPAVLELSTYTYNDYGVPDQSQNIFDRSWPTNSNPERGGWIHGITLGEASRGEPFEGAWFGKFFGNDDPSSDLPTSIGGTFGAFVDPGNQQQSERGLAGSFGVHRQ